MRSSRHLETSTSIAGSAESVWTIEKEKNSTAILLCKLAVLSPHNWSRTTSSGGWCLYFSPCLKDMETNNGPGLSQILAYCCVNGLEAVEVAPSYRRAGAGVSCSSVASRAVFYLCAYSHPRHNLLLLLFFTLIGLCWSGELKE